MLADSAGHAYQLPMGTGDCVSAAGTPDRPRRTVARGQPGCEGRSSHKNTYGNRPMHYSSGRETAC